MKLPGLLIDKLADSDLMARKKGAPPHAYIPRPRRPDGKHWPLMAWHKRLGACLRVLFDRGMVVYYQEDE